VNRVPRFAEPCLVILSGSSWQDIVAIEHGTCPRMLLQTESGSAYVSLTATFWKGALQSVKAPTRLRPPLASLC
jgi:hypothetical protein